MSEARVTNFGDYKLIRPLGKGGMGEIFYAHLIREAGFRKSVVIKRILSQLGDDPVFVERFLEEARLAATLTHRNIVHVYDFGRVDTTWFIAMEFVDGASLRDILWRPAVLPDGGESFSFEPLSLPAALFVAGEALQALAYAHGQVAAVGRKGVIHRDVSTGNLLVSRAGEVKLTDFGLARLARRTEEFEGAVEGTCQYMPPEQARGEAPDPRSDLFSLGSVILEMLTGRHPIMYESYGTGLTMAQTLERLRLGQLATATQLLRAHPVPQAILDWLDVAVAPDIHERWSSAMAMHDALREACRACGMVGDDRELVARVDRLCEQRGWVPSQGPATQIAKPRLTPKTPDTPGTPGARGAIENLAIEGSIAESGASPYAGEPNDGVAGPGAPRRPFPMGWALGAVIATVLALTGIGYFFGDASASRTPAAEGEASRAEQPPTAPVAAPVAVPVTGPVTGAVAGLATQPDLTPSPPLPTPANRPTDTVVASASGARPGENRRGARPPIAAGTNAASPANTASATNTASAATPVATGPSVPTTPEFRIERADEVVATHNGAVLGAGWVKFDPGAHVLRLQTADLKAVLRLEALGDPARPELAKLDLTSQPWSHVTINGVRIDQTPLSGKTLAVPGRHLIDLQTESGTRATFAVVLRGPAVLSASP
jgi:eukaryotic-like serine/threonine-protein kinase